MKSDNEITYRVAVLDDISSSRNGVKADLSGRKLEAWDASDNTIKFEVEDFKTHQQFLENIKESPNWSREQRFDILLLDLCNDEESWKDLGGFLKSLRTIEAAKNADYGTLQYPFWKSVFHKMNYFPVLIYTRATFSDWSDILKVAIRNQASVFSLRRSGEWYDVTRLLVMVLQGYFVFGPRFDDGLSKLIPLDNNPLSKGQWHFLSEVSRINSVDSDLLSRRITKMSGRGSFQKGTISKYFLAITDTLHENGLLPWGATRYDVIEWYKDNCLRFGE